MAPKMPSESLEYVTAYAHRAVKNSVSLRGPLPRYLSSDDVVQASHLHLREALGPAYETLIDAARQQNWEGAKEHEDLKRAVRQAIDQARGRADKRKKRKLPNEVPLDEELVADLPSPLIAETIDLAIDLQTLFAGFSKHDLEVWRLLREGWTVREIGTRLNVDYRRISETRQRLITVIQTALSSAAD